MPTNRELLIQQRKKEKGFPAPTTETAVTPKKDTSRLTGRKTPIKTGFQGIAKRKGQALLKEQPEAVAGMKGLAGLPKFEDPTKDVIDAVGEEVDTGGMPANVSLAPARVQQPRAQKGFSFGLPTDRMPSFAELGGAIGEMFKHVGFISKKRRALGLIPGRTATSIGKGLQPKDRAAILAKRLDDLTLPEEERSVIKSQLEEILNPEASDIDAILNE